MKRTFALVAIASGLVEIGLLVAVGALGAPDPGPRANRNPTVLLYSALGGVATISIAAIALLGWGVSVARRQRSVAAANPTAFVLVAQKTKSTASELGEISQSGVGSLPSLLVIGIGHTEVGFWGQDERRPLAVVPRNAIIGAEVVDTFNGRPLPAVQLEIASRSGSSRRLTFVPCRKNWEIWPILDREQTLAIARKFSA